MNLIFRFGMILILLLLTYGIAYVTKINEAVLMMWGGLAIYFALNMKFKFSQTHNTDEKKEKKAAVFFIVYSIVITVIYYAFVV